MNDRDKNNLMFLLSLSEEGLMKWYEQASTDDQEYADELLVHALNMVGHVIHESMIENEMNNMPVYKDALKVINKVKAC